MKKPYRVAVIILALVLLAALLSYFKKPAPEVYTGEMKDGLPYGFGTWTHPSGVYYAGNFSAGQWHGRGTWLHPDGIKYAGEWKEGNYHGRGVYILPGGGRYYGEWVEGQKEGAGIYRWPDGRHYIGQWLDDRPEGYGIMVNPDGFYYQGKWHQGRRHGEGSAIYQDSSEYHGQWLNDMRHGQGMLIFPDGSIFEGFWADNVQHGEGFVTYPDGIKVSGVWVKGSLQKVPVESITLDPDRATLLSTGGIITLEPVIKPENATNKDIYWESSNTNVATVVNGLVRAQSPGSATISATTADGGLKAISTITVSTTVTSVSGVKLDRTSITIRVGETAFLRATVEPSHANNRTVTWTSANTAIAAAYYEGPGRGGVRAYAIGETWVTVTTNDGQYTARCQVTVLPAEDGASRVVVPRLIGAKLSEAEEMLDKAFLSLGAINYEFHVSAPEGQIIGQQPAVGAYVTRASAVNLIVSRGSDPEPPQGDGEEE